MSTAPVPCKRRCPPELQVKPGHIPATYSNTAHSCLLHESHPHEIPLHESHPHEIPLHESHPHEIRLHESHPHEIRLHESQRNASHGTPRSRWNVRRNRSVRRVRHVCHLTAHQRNRHPQSECHPLCNLSMTHLRIHNSQTQSVGRQNSGSGHQLSVHLPRTWPSSRTPGGSHLESNLAMETQPCVHGRFSPEKMHVIFGRA